MTPFAEPETVATPPVKVIAVAVPKVVAVPALFVTVGLNDPTVPAPEKLRLYEPP